MGCNSLTEITVPSGITEIEERVFYGCSGLQEITIPSSVTDIEMGAFYEFSSLAKITMQGTTPPTFGEEAFTNCNFVTENLEGIEVLLGSLDTYKEAWADWAEYITAIADSVPPTGTIKVESHS